MQPDIEASLMNVLISLYGDREAQNIVKYLLPELKNISPEEFQNILNRLSRHEPWQYIIGKEWFYDLEFKVTPATLIPRPETEELVYQILQENDQHEMNVLDIGTGTGCIPIVLKKNRQQWNVWACDISGDALSVARENADRNGVEVHFFQENILQPAERSEQWDVIVSNPPYIPVQEKKLMSDNVLKYEPHLALFVSDEDPLIFYRKIGEYALRHLNPSVGRLYFELNEFYAEATRKMLQNQGFKQVEIISDLMGKQRMLVARK